MPYANIHWIKIKLEILQDKRFLFDLNDQQKLLFLGILILAGATKNEIPDDENFLKNRLNIFESPENIRKNIQKILEVYPKTISRDGKLKFKNFNKLHNPLKELQRNSNGTPKDAKSRVEKSRIDSVIFHYIKERGWEEDCKANASLLGDIFKRNVKPAKQLILVANNDEAALKAISAMAKEYRNKGLSWTLETVTKHYIELVNKDKYTKPCEAL